MKNALIRRICWTWNFHMSFLSWHWRAMESLGQNWIVVSNSVKIDEKFKLCNTLFCPAPLHCLSLHQSSCYLFQCKASNSLSIPCLSSPALHALLIFPVPCYTWAYLVKLTLDSTSYLPHLWSTATAENFIGRFSGVLLIDIKR